MTFEKRKKYNEIFHDVAYYLIIGIVSLLSVVILPMLSSDITGEVVWPQSKLEWIIWIVIRLAIAGVNILIFFSFKQQAKINVKDNAEFIEANRILLEIKYWKEIVPRSPKKYSAIQWGTKGSTLFISTLLSSIVLSKALLRFDLTEFITYLITIILAVVFGYLAMRKDEDYWTSEYLSYARYLQDKKAKEEKELTEVKVC